MKKEIKIEIEKFQDKFNPGMKIDTKRNYMYLRLSKLDNSLEKKARIKDAINKLKADLENLLIKYPNLQEEGFILFIEIKSAYKNSVREEFNKLYTYLFPHITSFKHLIEGKLSPIEKNIYVSSFDRLSRVFFYSLTFQLIRKQHGVNIWSLLPEEIEFEKKYKNINQDDNVTQTMFVFQLMMFSSMAAKHSEDLSNKIKKRITKKNGKTISNKTNKDWGRTKTISKKMKKKIFKLFDKFTAKEISRLPKVYQIVKGVKLPISENTINKIVQQERKKNGKGTKNN